jgi:hypothetical protein
MRSIAPTSAERLRTAIDGRVARARVVHGLGVIGRIGCVAACVWAIAIIAGRVTGAGVDARLVAATVLTATAIAAWFFARRAIASWPTRLAIALAAERTQPELGERISRAIDFLEETTAAGDGSPTLKALAIEQAGDAADRIGAAPIEDTARHVGFAAVAAVALSLLVIAGTRRDTVTTHATTTTAAPADDSSRAAVRPTFDPQSAPGQAAARIAALAGFERRLAHSLAGWFAEAPGFAAVDVPPRRRLLIAEAAALHDDCLVSVSADADMLAAAAKAADEAALSIALADLAADVDSAKAAVSAAIRDHRLAAAAEAAGHLADRLTEAAALLGIPVAATGNGSLEAQRPLGGNEPLSLDRDPRALLDRLDRLDRAVASASVAEGLAVTVPGMPPETNASAGTATGSGDGGAPAETPQSAGLAPGGDGIERVWSLVPEQSQTLRPQASDAATFPSHQRAIDAYYRLLLEQERSKP